MTLFTSHHRGRHATMVVLALIGSLWLTACHGEEPPFQAPADRSFQARPTGGSGHIWCSNFKGSYIAPMDASAVPRRLTPDTDPTPWPDGSQYTDYILSSGRADDTLRVLSARDNRVLHQITLPTFFAGDIRPSPVSKTTILTTYYAKVIDEKGLLLVLDVAAPRLIQNEVAWFKTQKFRWLPDGRILRLDTERGEVAVRSIEGSWRAIGRVAIPAGQKVRRVEINPQGTQLTMIFEVIDSTSADAWIAQLDGSRLERVTADQSTYDVHWSPDGQRLLFDYDTRSSMGTLSHRGVRLLWHAPASARNLTHLYDARGNHGVATLVRERQLSGSVLPLSCLTVHGWLP